MPVVSFQAPRMGQFPVGTTEGDFLVEIRDVSTGGVITSARVSMGAPMQVNFTVNLQPGRYAPRVARLDANGKELGDDTGPEVLIEAPQTVTIALPSNVVMSV